MKCSNCGTSVSSRVFKCPNCQKQIQDYRLTVEKTDALDRSLKGGLAFSKSKALLARLDEIQAVDESEVKGMLTINDLSNSIEKLKSTNLDRLTKLENMMTDSNDQMELQGIEISALLKRNQDKIQVIKNGILFLKHKRYKEAVEWWSLNRVNLDPSEKSLDLLLMIFQAYTLHLQDDVQRLHELQVKIKNHPLYNKYRK